MRFAKACFLGVACAAAIVACKSNNVERDRDGLDRNYDNRDQSGAGDRVGTTTVTGADVSSLSSSLVVERIVAARCARETACNNVGPDKHFTNYELCSNELHSRVGKDLDPSECPRGIDEGALDKCMDSIRSESCNNPIDTIQRIATCRTSDLCIKKP